jgi:hypothetical protein
MTTSSSRHAVNLTRFCRCGIAIMKFCDGALFSSRLRNQTEHEAHLNGNEEGCTGIALCAFKGAQIEARFVRLNAGQPHRFAASRAVHNSELRNIKNLIGLIRQHDTPLKTRRERDALSHRLLPVVGR